MRMRSRSVRGLDFLWAACAMIQNKPLAFPGLSAWHSGVGGYSEMIVPVFSVC